MLLTQNPANNILTPAARELRRRWQLILGVLPSERRVQFSSANLYAQAEELFAAPAPGWPLARHHSPDLMIGARTLEDIERGTCTFVLGEAHVTLNALAISLFIEQHAHPEEIRDAIDGDFPAKHPSIVLPRSFPRVTNRTTLRGSTRNLYIEVSRDSLHTGDPSHVMPAAAFVVRPRGDRLCVCAKDGSVEYDAVETLGDLLTLASLASIDFMHVFAPDEHTPRISIDRLVVSRETWRFPLQRLAFLHEEQEAARYLQVRRWMHEQRLPRFAFFKVPTEIKPQYLDFDSPVYVEIMAKAARRALQSHPTDGWLLVTEMLPGHEELWLPDAHGNRYTSEFRLVARDLLTLTDGP